MRGREGRGRRNPRHSVADLEAADDEHRIGRDQRAPALEGADAADVRHSMLLRALREARHVTDEASAVEALATSRSWSEGSTKN